MVVEYSFGSFFLIFDFDFSMAKTNDTNVYGQWVPSNYRFSQIILLHMHRKDEKSTHLCRLVKAFTVQKCDQYV